MGVLGPRGGLCALLLTSILKPDLHLRRYRARVRVRTGAPRPVHGARAGEVEVEIMCSLAATYLTRLDAQLMCEVDARLEVGKCRDLVRGLKDHALSVCGRPPRAALRHSHHR